jgi:predicted transcriptional regulator of viral defense system
MYSTLTLARFLGHTKSMSTIDDDFEFRTRTLGELEAKLYLSLEESGLTVVTLSEAAQFLPEQQARRALTRLEKKGWLERLRRGRYAVIPSRQGFRDTRIIPSVKFAGDIIPNTYVGWWAAAAFHSLTWQRPFLFHVAALAQHKPTSHEGVTIEFVKIAKQKHFGVDDNNEDRARVSSVEKTALDCLDRPDLSGGIFEAAIILKSAARRVGVRPLIDVAMQMNSIATMRKLGFMLDTAAADLFDADSRAKLMSQIPRSNRTRLGRKEEVAGDFGYVSEWQLHVNISKAELLREVG